MDQYEDDVREVKIVWNEDIGEDKQVRITLRR